MPCDKMTRRQTKCKTLMISTDILICAWSINKNVINANSNSKKRPTRESLYPYPYTFPFVHPRSEFWIGGIGEHGWKRREKKTHIIAQPLYHSSANSIEVHQFLMFRRTTDAVRLLTLFGYMQMCSVCNLRTNERRKKERDTMSTATWQLNGISLSPEYLCFFSFVSSFVRLQSVNLVMWNIQQINIMIFFTAYGFCCINRLLYVARLIYHDDDNDPAWTNHYSMPFLSCIFVAVSSITRFRVTKSCNP